MPSAVRRADYFYLTIGDERGEGHRLLSHLASLGVNLLAFTAVPVGPTRTQFALFPEDEVRLVEAIAQSGGALDGPHPALLVQGDDELGAVASIHETLLEADVDVYATTGVTDGRGSFGYLIYVQPEQYERAASALGL